MRSGDHISFLIPGKEKPVTCSIRDPNAKLAPIAATAARRAGVAGLFRCLKPHSDEILEPAMPVGDLEAEEVGSDENGPREAHVRLDLGLTPAAAG